MKKNLLKYFPILLLAALLVVAFLPKLGNHTITPLERVAALVFFTFGFLNVVLITDWYRTKGIDRSASVYREPASSIVRVAVNGIEVGALPTAQYEQIVKDVKREWRTYALQTIDVIRTIIRCVLLMFALIPLEWCAVVVLVSLFSFDNAKALFEWLATSTPEQLVYSVRALSALTMTLNFVVIFTAFPHWVADANRFDLIINYRIRKLLEVPTPGDVSVYTVRHGKETDGEK